MKKILIIFAILLLLSISIPIPILATEVTINGKTLSFDVQPTSINGRTMVPLRTIFESLGAQVNWEGTTRTITATRGETVIILQINNPIATVNGKRVTLDVPAKTINNRTMVPTRFIAESLGAKVNWISTTGTVQIITDGNIDFVPTGENGSTFTPIAPTANPAKVLKIGDSYGGGIVAYILQAGDFGYDLKKQHGLIAAVADQTEYKVMVGLAWTTEHRHTSYTPSPDLPLPSDHAERVYEVPGTLLTIGSGAANTDKIVALMGPGSSYAAGLARAYRGGGYKDWYLPSIDELQKLYVNRVAIGKFQEGKDYWSSSEHEQADYITTAWTLNFRQGSEISGIDKSWHMNNAVRAVRSF